MTRRVFSLRYLVEELIIEPFEKDVVVSKDNEESEWQSTEGIILSTEGSTLYLRVESELFQTLQLHLLDMHESVSPI